MDRFPSRPYRQLWTALVVVAFVAVTSVARAQSEVESNDDPASADAITTDGALYSAAINSIGDLDWWSFGATAGDVYTITTSLLEGPDTWLDLYDSDGFTLLASNDDVDESLASEIVWTAASTDTLYFVVYDIADVPGGYSLAVTSAAGAVPVIDIDSPTASEADGFVDFSITMDMAYGTDITIPVVSVGGTATDGVDYASVEVGSITIFAGETFYELSVDIFDDADDEDDETFDVNLGTPSAGTLGVATGVATILDDDEPAIVPSLDITGVTVVEGDDEFTPTTAAVTVSLSEATTVDITFDVDTADGSAVAAEGDYTEAVTWMYTIPAGDTSVDIDIDVLADSIAEPDEYFDVVVSNIVGATGFTTTASVWIENDDLLELIITSDLEADGFVDSTVSPYLVREYNDPASVLTLDVTGGVGPTFTVNIVSAPALGVLVDATMATELYAGSTLSITAGTPVDVEFIGTPQNSTSFESSDAFIVSVMDDGDGSLTSGSVIVELTIEDVNQPVVVDREGLTYVASGSTANIAAVDFEDIDFDGIDDPSIYDTDGDNLVFSNPVSALGGEVWVVGGALQYEAPIYSDVANASGPLTDTITFEVYDDSWLGSDPVSADISVKIQPVADMTFTVYAGDESFWRDLRVGLGPEGFIETSATTTGSISELTTELSPPEAPGSSFQAWVGGEQALLRDIWEISSSAFEYSWSLYARTGSSGFGNWLEWDGAEVNELLTQFEIYTGVVHSATIANSATGETWNLAGEGYGSIELDDNQSYYFDIAFTPAAGTTSLYGSMNSGWNLISVPGHADLSPIDDLSNGAFVWDPYSGYTGVGFLTQDEVPAVTTGVFVNSNGGDYYLDADVDSPDVRDVTLYIEPGWNLIGAPSDVNAERGFPVSNITSLFGNQAAVFGFDQWTGSYELAAELISGSGYWVYNDTGFQVETQLTQPRHLSGDGSSLFHGDAAMVFAPSLASLDWSMPLSLSTDDGAMRTVQLGLSDDATAGYDRLDIAMPPTPPVGAYARLSVDVDDAVGQLSRSVQQMDRRGTEWTISARVDASGVVEWQKPNVPAHWRLVMDTGSEVVDMSERRSVRVGGGTHELRVLMSWVAPTATRLMPNYPNPFNPETWIPFELSDAAEVTVRVYGQDGSVIRTLDLGYRAEGYYTTGGDAAYWDGRNESGEQVASGVYLYELQAGDYRAMRRMVIMK